MLTYGSFQSFLEIEKEFNGGNISPSFLSFLTRMGIKVLNFQEMVKFLKKGKKAFRLTWSKGRYLWEKNGILVHNSANSAKKTACKFFEGFPYLIEIEDVLANDWIVIEEIIAVKESSSTD